MPQEWFSKFIEESPLNKEECVNVKNVLNKKLKENNKTESKVTEEKSEKDQTFDSEHSIHSNIHQGGSAIFVGKDPNTRIDGSDSRDGVHENPEEMTFLEALGGRVPKAESNEKSDSEASKTKAKICGYCGKEISNTQQVFRLPPLSENIPCHYGCYTKYFEELRKKEAKSG